MKAPLTSTPSNLTNFGRLDINAPTSRALNHMKVGQIVDAFVLSNNQHGQVKLRLGNTVLTAATNASMPENAHLQLRVIQMRPQMLLQLLPAASEDDALKSLAKAASSLLPSQDGLAPSLAGLLNRAFVNSTSKEHLHIRLLLQSLIKAIPERQSISHTDGLRQAILHSGLFLETILSRTRKHRKSDISKDLKACLVRLKHALGRHSASGRQALPERNTHASPFTNSVSPPPKSTLPLPQHNAPVGFTIDTKDIEDFVPNIATRTRSALSRIGLLQVNSAENFNNGEYIWQIELPVQHDDTIEIVSISIEKEHYHGTNSKETVWSVNLAVDLPVLGVIEIRVSIFKDGVSTVFRPASSTTAELIDKRLERLRSRLIKQGIRVINLNCQDSLEKLRSSDSAASTLEIIV